MIANIFLLLLLGATIMRLVSLIRNRPGSQVGAQFIDLPLYGTWFLYGCLRLFA